MFTFVEKSVWLAGQRPLFMKPSRQKEERKRSNVICKTGSTFKTLGSGPSLISMPTQSKRPSWTSWVPKCYECPLSRYGWTTAPWMSVMTALGALPQPTKPSASRHWATQGIRTRRSIWSPVGFCSKYVLYRYASSTCSGGTSPEMFSGRRLHHPLPVSLMPWPASTSKPVSYRCRKWNPVWVFRRRRINVLVNFRI